MNHKRLILRPNPETRFQNPNHPLIRGFYQYLINCLGYRSVRDTPTSMIKAIDLYFHILGLRKAKPYDLRIWKCLNVIDDKERFLDPESEIGTDERANISRKEFNQLIYNINIYSLAWAGYILLDPNDHSVIMTNKGYEEAQNVYIKEQSKMDRA